MDVSKEDHSILCNNLLLVELEIKPRGSLHVQDKREQYTIKAKGTVH